MGKMGKAVFSEEKSSFCRDVREAGCAALLLIWSVFGIHRAVQWVKLKKMLPLVTDAQMKADASSNVRMRLVIK